MNILIVGGGIGGPALATFLSRQGKNVTLIEKSPEWKDIGFGVTIWGIGRKVLNKLGIEEQIAEVGHIVTNIHLMSQNESTIINLGFERFADYGGRAVIVPRTKLHEFILQAIPPEVKIMLGTTVESLNQENGEVHVAFNDGTTGTFDLVVGADGVHSGIRESFGIRDVEYYNWAIQVFWVPEHISSSKEVICLSENNRTLCFYPTKERTFIAIANYACPGKDKKAESFLPSFVPYLLGHGWSESDIEKVLSESHTYYMDDMRYVRMGKWNNDRIALLGDARHAFAPIIGMGANLALEDAEVLAEELGKVEAEDIPLALDRYAERRTPRVNKVRRVSRFIEPWFNTHSAFFVFIRGLVVPYLPKSIIEQMFISILNQKI